MPRVYTKTANKGAKKARNCTRCHQPIEAGQKFYQWCPRATRSGSGYNRFRHVACGSPRQSELYPFNKLAPLWDAQADADGEITLVSVDERDHASALEAIKATVQTVADAARSVGEEYGESADNIESGFGHETYQSSELREKADALEAWADELEQWEPAQDEPDLSEFDDPEDPTTDQDFDADERESERETAIDDAIEAWLDDVKSEASDVISEIPV